MLRKLLIGIAILIGLVVFLAIAAAVGCVAYLELNAGKQKRSDLSSWSTTTNDYQGISYEIPDDLFANQLHPRMNGFAVDSTWAISISIQKETPEQREGRVGISDKNPLSQDEEYMGWLRWMDAFHEDVSVRQTAGCQSQYRRDIRTPDGAIIFAHITYTYCPFSESEKQADEEAILRIIDSITPLPDSIQDEDADPDQASVESG